MRPYSVANTWFYKISTDNTTLLLCKYDSFAFCWKKTDRLLISSRLKWLLGYENFKIFTHLLSIPVITTGERPPLLILLHDTAPTKLYFIIYFKCRCTIAGHRSFRITQHWICRFTLGNSLDCYGDLVDAALAEILVSVRENPFDLGIGISVRLCVHQKWRQSDAAEIRFLLHDIFGGQHSNDGHVV